MANTDESYPAAPAPTGGQLEQRCQECGYLAGRCPCPGGPSLPPPPAPPRPAPAGPLLTPAEAAARFGVTVPTLCRWAREGKIISVRTPGGGNRRYFQDEIERLTESG